jgi:hypothetical protein
MLEKVYRIFFMKLYGNELSEADLSRIVEMAWEDRIPFEAINTLYGLNEIIGCSGCGCVIISKFVDNTCEGRYHRGLLAT